MSTTVNARNTAETSTRPSATSGAKSRAPSSRLGAKERPLSSAEVIPEDSASNGPHRRSASGAQKMNGHTTSGERQTGRVHLATRENLQVRTRSPVKLPMGDGVEDRGSKERVSTRPSSRAVEGQAQSPRKEKKVLRGFLWKLEYVFRASTLISWNSKHHGNPKLLLFHTPQRLWPLASQLLPCPLSCPNSLSLSHSQI